MRRLLVLLLLASPLARADLAIVVGAASPLASLSQRDASDLYLGRGGARNSGDRPLLLDHPRSSELRGRFFRSLNGMDLRRVDAYWARLQFSGDTQPPLALRDSGAILDAVRRDPLAIGYVDAANVTPDVRVLLTLRE